MKIFLIIPTLQQGGAERVMSELANFFVSYQGTEIHLVLLTNQKDFYQINDNVIIHRLCFQNKGKIQKKNSELQTFVKLRKLLKIEKPDAVLSFMGKYNIFTILASSFLNLKVFVSDRSSPIIQIPNYIQILKKITYKHAAGIIAQTLLAKSIIEKKIKNDNIKVIPNPIKQLKLCPEIKREKTVVSVGRLISTKNFDRLIDIFYNVNNLEWKLIIIGGDANKEINSKTLQGKINKLKANDRIQLVGAQKDIENYLLKSSILAFTSSSEGFPNVIGEAMSAGLPVISYDCVAGPSEMIENGKNGFLIPLFNDELFSEKLLYLMENESIRKKMGTYAHESIRKYSVESIGEKFYKFITN